MLNFYKKKITTATQMIGLGVILLSLTSCNLIYRATGDVLVNFGEDVMLPYTLKDDDMRLGCQSFGMVPLLASFEEVGSDPRQLTTMLYMVGGSCAEAQAREEEMRYLRAIKNQDTVTAKDARTKQKRHHLRAAKRFYKGFRYTMDYFEPTDGECPRIKGDLEEFVWLMGLLSGLMAVTNDAGADLTANIPRNIPAQTERWATCVPNKKWWGMPNGTRAAIWSILPLLMPEGEDPEKFLVESQQLSINSGVRIGFALRAMAYQSKGETEALKNVIREFAETEKNGFIPNTEFKMVDTIAREMILTLSDLMWTESEGLVTPFGALGTFPDDVEAVDEDDLDIDDFFD